MDAQKERGTGLPINEWITKKTRWNEFYSVNPKRDPSLCGTAIINKVDFHVVGEYDEVFRGWGGEDLELYERLKKSSKTHKHINERYFSAIQHDDNIRQLSTEQGGIGTKKQALIAARIYTKIISGFYTNNKILSFEDRTEIMCQIKNFISNTPANAEKPTLELNINNPKSFLNKPLHDYNKL
jgi:hypothetical protein